MKKSKSQAIVTVVLLVMTVILFCFIGFKIYEQNFKTNNTTEPIISTNIAVPVFANQSMFLDIIPSFTSQALINPK